MLGLFGGCADKIPGLPPPEEQVYFPAALKVIGDDLVVVSSNFDQRYNAGRVHLYDLPTLVAKLPTASDAPVVFDEELQPALKASLRIDQFGSDIVPAQGASGENWLLIPSRGRNQLTVLDYAPGSLSCGPAPTEESRFDCQENRAVDTQAQDPFAVVVTDSGTANATAYVAHLRSTQDPDDLIYRQAVTRIGLNSYADVEPDVQPFVFNDYGGVTGMVMVPQGFLGIPVGDARRQGTLVVVERNVTPTMTLRGFTIRGNQLEQTHSLNLGAELNAGASRGLYFDEARGRLYVSLRFQENADSFNAAVVSFDVTGTTFAVRGPVTEVGEELGTPIFHQVVGGPRLLYVPDIRLNAIWVLDVSTDVPAVVHRIQGQGIRDFSGVPVQVPLLASPTGMTFYTSGARTFGIVSNFANSTLAFIDVTDVDPRKHRVVARLGRDIDAEGEKEGP